MKTIYGKLTFLIGLLIVAAYLLIPMRAGQEDILVLDPSGLRMAVGDSYLVKCRLASENTNQQIRFGSSDERVAVIETDGTVYARSSGEATITATASGGAYAQTRVVVTGTPLNALSINTDQLVLGKGQYSGLTVSYNKDASDTRLQWISGDESIATVDSAGRVLGVRGGETTVYVSAPNGVTASARVLVDVDSIAAHITPNRLTVGVGAEVPLKVSYLPADSTDTVRRWSSSAPGILQMDQEGTLHALSEGSAYVSVITNDGITTGTEVKVEPAPKDLQMDPIRATLDRNETLQMQLRFLQPDGSLDEHSSHLVIWRSSDPNVASVDKNGFVTALRSGMTRITATADGFEASCDITVQVRVHEIILDQKEIYLLREDTQTPIQLNWKIDPADADDAQIIFSSNNTQVATVSSTGLVEMTGGYGTAVITAGNSGGAFATFTVNVVTQLPDPDQGESDSMFEETGSFGDASDDWEMDGFSDFEN